MPNISVPVACREQDLVYKVAGERTVSIAFLPPTKKVFDRAPVYLIIPGGGWHISNKESMVGFSKLSSDDLRARGWATVSVEYRYAPADGVVMDQIVSDCMDAARYLSRFADVLEVDPHRILTSGHSAGAHLALMMAVAPHAGFVADSPYDSVADDFTVIASAPMSAPIILYRDSAGFCPQGFNYADVFANAPTERDLHRASPIDYVNPLTVPTLVVCGTHDTLVLPENSTRFYERCREVGAPGEILYSHFGGHCFEPMVEGKTSFPDFAGVQKAITEFAIRFE